MFIQSITTNEFLELFPKAKLNIENQNNLHLSYP